MLGTEESYFVNYKKTPTIKVKKITHALYFVNHICKNAHLKKILIYYLL